jgi:hypothetical protein
MPKSATTRQKARRSLQRKGGKATTPKHSTAARISKKQRAGAEPRLRAGMR